MLNSLMMASCGSQIYVEIMADQSKHPLSEQVEEETVVSAMALNPANGTVAVESIITLSYTHSESKLADSCSVINTSGITISTDCFCDSDGVCTVGLTGTNSGTASFDYSVTVNSKISNFVSVSYIIDPVALNCPTGFVVVEGNGSLGTTDFCVMKYEARNDGFGNAISIETGEPWHSIQADDGIASNNADAFEKCQNITEVGFDGNFGLISNPQWMTIARAIESVNSNWSGGSVGTGYLSRGWSANNSVDGFQNTGRAPGSEADCLYNTGSNACAPTGDHKLKRTHLLPNGSEIWDFAGNVHELVDWSTVDAVYTQAYNDGNSGGFDELINLVGSMVQDDIGPNGTYDSSHNVGQLEATTTGSATRRGGGWSSGIQAGVYTVIMTDIPTYVRSSIGFRCTYRASI